MNLFENLQLMKESDTSIVSEFKEFLSNKNAQYIANEIGETKDGMQIVIYDGDWKHEHLYMKHLLDEFFTNKGINISITSEEIGESDQDTFSARYDITFNVKSPEYSADIISEDVDATNEIKYQVTCQLAISNEEVYSEHSNLKDAIASARKAQQSFMNVKIKDLQDGNSWYDIDAAEQDLKDGIVKESVTDDIVLPKRESTNDSDWEFIEETTTNDEIFGDITEGGYYIKHYNNDMTGIIYPPSESEKLYRAKLTRKNKFNSFGSNAFIELDSAKEFLDTRAYELTSVTYEEIKQQLEEIDTHEYLKIFIDEPTKLGNVSVSIEGTLINGDPITFYDSSYIVNQRDIDFIKEQYAKAVKQIDVMRERGYLGVKDESSKVEESNHNEILDRDYKTGEKIYNELVEYLDTLDQIAMDGEDCNWEPSEFNAKNLNADGEIYLVSGAYILIYPYINEWAEDYFRVLVVEPRGLQPHIKAGIENVFNMFKTNKWKLVFDY